MSTRRLQSSRDRGAATAIAAIVCCVSGCSSPAAPPRDRPGELADPAWVRIYDPQRAANGYNLVLLRQRTPALLDMNGRVVHSWPEARVKSRVRLLPDGSLLGIALGRGVVEYSWEGDLTWSWVPESGFVHHDVVRLQTGNTLIIVRADGEVTDRLIEVDRAGAVVWSWSSGEALVPFIDDVEATQGDVTHINSVQELPPNRWSESGDERFRPGHLLISARNLDAVFVIDRDSGKATWSYESDLDHQHEALMIPPDQPRAGSILIFNNRLGSFRTDRESQVLEIEPASDKVVWEYRSPGFYSPTGGLEQPLANGNVLIESTRGGRVLEVTRSGETVWEWVPPFDPVRSQRVAYDHTPQLAALASRRELAVVAEPGYRHVDPEAYRFARRGSREQRTIDGAELNVLQSTNDCRRLLLPMMPYLEVVFGLDRDRLRAEDRKDFSARFLLRLTERRSGEEAVLVDELLDLPSGEVRRELTVDLEAHALENVVLCVETLASASSAKAGPSDGGFTYWQQPAIRSAARAVDGEEGGLPSHLTPEELEAARRHLEAMGYVQ